MKYIFNAPESPIKEVDIPADRGRLEASFALPDAITPQQVADFRVRLQQQGYTVLAGEKDEKAVLRVHGKKPAQHMLADIADAGLIQGDYIAQPAPTQPKEEEKPFSSDKIKLMVAGGAYLTADMGVILAGWLRKDYAEMAQGAVWAIPNSGLIVNAMQTAQSRMEYLYHDLSAFLEKNAIETPIEIQKFLSDNAAKDDFLHNAQRFFNDHGTVTNNLAEAAGAIFGIKAGLNQDNPFKVIASALMGTGMAVSTMVHGEKQEQPISSTFLGNAVSGNSSAAPSPNQGVTTFLSTVAPQEEKEKNGLVSYFMERPQRIAGGAAFAQNLIKIAGGEYIDKANRRSFDGVLNDAYQDLQKKNPEQFKAQFEENKYNDIWKQKGEYYTETQKWENIKKEARAGLKELSPEDPRYEILDKKYNKDLDDAHDNIKELNSRKQSYYLSDRAASIDQACMVTYMFANAVYSTTKLDNGADLVKSGGINDIVEVVANIVASAPPSRQTIITHEMATFLGNHVYVPLSVDELIAQINDKVEVIAPITISTPERDTLERIYAKPLADPDTKKAALEELYHQSGVQVKDKIHAGKIAMNEPSLAASV